MSVCLSWAPNWSIVMPWYSEHRSMPDLAWRIFTCAKESLSEEKYVEEFSCDWFKRDIIKRYNPADFCIGPEQNYGKWFPVVGYSLVSRDVTKKV